MKIYQGPATGLDRVEGRWALTLGTFDGVHRGHQSICAEARQLARSGDFAGSGLITFGRHPRAVLTPEHGPRILTAMEERLELLAATEIDRIYILDFDEELRRMEYDRFVIDLMVERLGLAHFILGHDVHFGRDRRGTFHSVADLAEREGFDVSQVASLRHRKSPISSTRIRDCVAAGEMDEAVTMLGHPYLVFGEVVAGRGDGKGLGFPTANLAIADPSKLMPMEGVYAVWARWDGSGGWRQAVSNLGTSPTIGQDQDVRLEVHVLEGEPDLYGKRLEVAFGPRIRGEQRFESLAALTARIAQDAAEAPSNLARVEPPGRPEDLARLAG